MCSYHIGWCDTDSELSGIRFGQASVTVSGTEPLLASFQTQDYSV